MSIEPVVYGSGDGGPVGFIGLGKMGGPMAAGYERLAEETGVGSRFGAAAAALYREALERGLGESDHTAIAQLIEDQTGIRLRAGSGGAA